MKTLTMRLLIPLVSAGMGGMLMGQSADVSLPKNRETTLESAEKLVSSRGSPVGVSVAYANPFVWKEAQVESAPVAVANPAVAPSVGGEELLARLAARIPATGIAFLGNEGVLLLGQKKLKVGDAITISFEGQDYELSISAISSASFTVKRGSLFYTRPTQLAGSTTPNSRP